MFVKGKDMLPLSVPNQNTFYFIIFFFYFSFMLGGQSDWLLSQSNDLFAVNSICVFYQLSPQMVLQYIHLVFYLIQYFLERYERKEENLYVWLYRLW